MTKQANKKKTINREAVLVSYNLQLAFVGFVFVAFLGLFIASMTILAYQGNSFQTSFIWGQFIYGAYGLLLFIPAYLLLPNRKNIVHQMFIAALYTILGYVFYELVMTIVPWFLLRFVPFFGYNNMTQGPNWIQRYGYTFILPLIVWLLYTATLLYIFARRQKR